ncbi:CHRD domain-containing protein [Fodinibius halophilus]|uniref:CHRD domain-containing protein n=1 Tax=Fodinibius halophilus TaxID=1736908 RepID=A0A6M1TK71_9BACT|nr:CHRD domain-containing protein [Fodinibius halophilus]NGP88950.1 CHRD domain-containing protein [Fodinibius halophilus]
MKKLKLLSSAIIVLLFCFYSMPTDVHAQNSQMITLGGYKMKPRVATSGSGMVTVKLKGDTLTVHGDFENLTNRYSGAYIMVDIRGEGGNQLYKLKTDLNEEQNGGKLKTKENRFVLSAAEKQLLKEGKLYITINTFDHRNGEIRGNIAPMGK